MVLRLLRLIKKQGVSLRRGQAALEFLASYGWAFLIILIMMAGLSYFGVLDPTRFLPDKCLFGAGVGVCRESGIVANTTHSNLQFGIVNNLGSAINLTSATAIVSGTGTACASPTITVSTLGPSPSITQTIAAMGLWNASAMLYINMSGCTIAVGERPTVKMTLNVLPIGKVYAKAIEGEISVKRTG